MIWIIGVITAACQENKFWNDRVMRTAWFIPWRVQVANFSDDEACPLHPEDLLWEDCEALPHTPSHAAACNPCTSLAAFPSCSYRCWCLMLQHTWLASGSSLYALVERLAQDSVPPFHLYSRLSTVFSLFMSVILQQSAHLLQSWQSWNAGIEPFRFGLCANEYGVPVSQNHLQRALARLSEVSKLAAQN